MEQLPLSFCSSGLLLEQVPLNSPSFLTRILMAIPAKPSASSAMVKRRVVHSMGLI